MREILIKNTPLKEFNLDYNIMDFFTKHSGCPSEIRNKKIVANTIKGTIPHKSFADYLTIAYNTDYGIVIKPDFIWFTILNEISKIINDDPEKYRKSFTKSKKKIQIVGSGDSMVELPVHQMMELILKQIPSEKLKKEDFILPLSTADDDSRFAFAVSFLETVSPYYGLAYYGCMYNKIKLLGEPKDYQIMVEALNRLNKQITGLPQDYIDQVSNLLWRIQSNWNNDGFWSHILWTESGYLADTVDGWILGLYKDKQYYNNHIAKIEYEELTTNIEYTMVCGLLSSKIEDGYMIPNFERIIALKESKVVEDLKEYGRLDLGEYNEIHSVSTNKHYESRIVEYVETEVETEEIPKRRRRKNKNK